MSLAVSATNGVFSVNEKRQFFQLVHEVQHTEKKPFCRQWKQREKKVTCSFFCVCVCICYTLNCIPICRLNVFELDWLCWITWTRNWRRLMSSMDCSRNLMVLSKSLKNGLELAGNFYALLQNVQKENVQVELSSSSLSNT